ncbi:glutamate--cysteine ligase [Gallaecimonas xiamenensis]|uniref:Glutamate--cysteine ligase n=1 Tax=Gallaecimonas xiamenensis 3-C-1 TaxID=745411 RepID=K2JMK8_9GAMM|nr:glutamate--cysteine ligase [Gallaecimonas xiamenensis]EKE71684.1 glutamate--cysteine ligase [Gallaecimonas xiamenensis 3-C-1]
MLNQLQRRLDALAAQDALSLLFNPRRGVERETLRIAPEGRMALSGHPKALGSTLTHEFITTDFAENLLEFITPVSDSVEQLMASLSDIHVFTQAHLGDEVLWPLSMPCYVEDQNSIPLADYGSSNIGRMKRVYREGLKNRYGAMMQLIAGVHYNFSLPDAFWQHWSEGDQSSAYMGLLRNYRRLVWVLPYLFGASPSLCGSFLGGRGHHLPFEKRGKGTLFLPYATSLRLSDLGYTSSAQAGLRIDHNSIDGYIRDLRQVIATPSEEFAKIGVKVDGQYRQLNANLLQIENELYAPIRPKRVTERGEKPTEALERGGVQYVEVRALDVDPFSPLGVDEDTVRFMDIFLLSCLLLDAPVLDNTQWSENLANYQATVLEGRKPGLMLQRQGQPLAMADWFAELLPVWQRLADGLDAEQGGDAYRQSLAVQENKMQDSSLTPSARLLAAMDDRDNGQLGLALAQQHRQALLAASYRRWSPAFFEQETQRSLAAQEALEAEDSQPFDDFLGQYFQDLPQDVA